MIELLEKFVPCAQNTHELKHRRNDREDELGVFFWKVMAKAHDKARLDQTVQGLYAFSAAGDLYFENNNRDPEKLVRLLTKARAAFDENPPAKVEGLRALKPDRFFAAPEGASVVRVFSRILSLGDDVPKDDLNRSVGRDALWILRPELDEIRKKLEQAKEGEEVDLPRALAARIARYHLLDNVRGEPNFWRGGEVEKASFKLSRISSEKGLRAKVSGSFRLVSGETRGFEGTLDGELEIDSSEGDARSLASLRVLADGSAWGEGTYTGGAPKGKFPLRVAFVFPVPPLAGTKKAAPVVPPQGVIDGREEYLKPALDR